MGLDTSHDAFHGAYSAFNRFRQIVCQAAGGSFPSHYKRNDDGSYVRDEAGLFVIDNSLDGENWYIGDEYSEESHPGLWAFLCHSDCDGEIPPETCVKVAADLEALLPEIERLETIHGLGGGHIEGRGGFSEVTRKFIAGCRDAASENEPLVFA